MRKRLSARAKKLQILKKNSIYQRKGIKFILTLKGPFKVLTLKMS